MTALGTTTTRTVDIEWTVLPIEHGGCVLWFGAWLPRTEVDVHGRKWSHREGHR